MAVTHKCPSDPLEQCSLSVVGVPLGAIEEEAGLHCVLLSHIQKSLAELGDKGLLVLSC